MRLHGLTSEQLWYHGRWVCTLLLLIVYPLTSRTGYCRYDYVLSDVFREPKTRGFWHISNHVQSYLETQYRGYLPPGSCIIVPLPDDVSGPTRFILDPDGRDQDAEGNTGVNYGNPWGATSMAVLPTMREPANVEWHQDLVYNCMWTLQVEIEKWNASLSDDKKPISRVLMTGLGTGCGKVPSEKCASQMVLSVKYFNEPVLVQPRWSDVGGRGEFIRSTIITSTSHKLQVNSSKIPLSVKESPGNAMRGVCKGSLIQ